MNLGILFFIFTFYSLVLARDTYHEVLFDAFPSYDQFCAFFPSNKTCTCVDAYYDGLQNSTTLCSKELAYITACEHDRSTAALYKVVQRLRAQGSCDSVRIKIQEQEDTYTVTFVVKTQWIVRKVSIVGIAYGKYMYQQLYEIGYGEPFSMLLHEKSLEALHEKLEKEGYLAAQVNAYFSFDEDKRALDVRIIINKKNQFRITDCTFTAYAYDHTYALPEALMDSAQKIIKNSVVKRYYTDRFIQNKIQILQQFLRDQGYATTDIVIKKTCNYDDSSLVLSLSCGYSKNKRYDFFGNHYFSSSFLYSFVKEIEQNIAQIPDHMVQQELQELYHAHGFWKCSIQTQQEKKRTLFVVTEGDRVRIKHIALKGITYKKNEWIIKSFFTDCVGKYFQKDRIKKAIKKVILWYVSQGFHDARLLRYKYYPCAKGTPAHYVLELIFDEGKQYCFKECKIIGYDNIQHAFTKIFKEYARHDPLANDALEQQKEWLTNYTKKKKKNCTVTYQIERLNDASDISDMRVLTRVVWHIKEYEQSYFGKTIIKGPLDSSCHMVRSSLTYRYGDVWDIKKVQTSLARLKSFGVFQSVSLRPLSMHDRLFQDCLLTLQEDDPYEVKMRLGYQQISKNFAFHKGSSYKAGATFIIKNPFKKLDRIVCDADVSYFEQRLFSAYHRPFFIRDAVCEGIVKLYVNNYKQPISLTSKTSIYQAAQHGFLFGVTSTVSSCNIGLSCGCEWMETKDVAHDVAEALYFESSLLNKKVPYLFFEPTFFLQALDNNLDPHAGLFFLLTCKSMIPLKWDNATYFVRCLLEQGVFIPFSRFVCAIRMRCGHIFRESFKRVMPPDRFYLGGTNTIRSYQMDKCPPLGSFVDTKGAIQWVAQGGKTMYNMNFEVRFPLQKFPLSIVVFQDVGFLAHSVDDIFSSTPLVATGFGFRYATPIGPLRFDVGWKWKKTHPQENGYAWFLTFGHAF